jgi:hypothetical protein
MRSRAAWRPSPPIAAGSPWGVRAAVLLRRGWANGAWVGVGTGVAAALTAGPVLFLGYFAVTRQWRPALTGLATAAGLLAAAALVAPHQTVVWATDVLWRLDGVDHVGNQSLAGVLARLYDSATTPLLMWFSFALLVVAVGMIRARAAHADGDEIAAFLLVGLTGAIVGPISETHALVWVLPAILILVDAAAAQWTVDGQPRPPTSGLPTSRPAAARLPTARLPTSRLPTSRLPTARLPTSRRSWSCGWPYAAFHRFCANHNSKIAAMGKRSFGYAAAAALVYLLFVTAPMESFGGPLAANAYAMALILLVNAVPHRPGVAPAFLANRWAKRPRPIPPARRPVA